MYRTPTCTLVYLSAGITNDMGFCNTLDEVYYIPIGTIRVLFFVKVTSNEMCN